MRLVKNCLCLCLLLMSMWSLQAVSAGIPKGVIKKPGKPAPELKLNTIDGDSFDLKSIRGRWAFVHFWASWCGPCRKEMPTIQEMHDKVDPRKWQFVLVNTAEDEDTIFNFMSIVAPDMVPLMDSDGLVTEKWQSRGLPSTFLVDPQGRIQFLALGGRPWNQDEYLTFLKSLPEKQ